MKRIKRTLAALGVGYLLLIFLTYMLQERLIFHASQLPEDYTYNFEWSFEEINIEGAQGNSLNGLYFTLENPDGLILYYHGNAGDLSRWGKVVAYFQQFNYEVIVMDYRGYGKSTGNYDQDMMYAEAERWYAFAKTKTSEDRITLYGRSLGTTFATYVASKNKPERLILESPFKSLKDVARKRYWFLPVRYLLKYEFPTHTFISGVQCEVSLFHGTQDRVVPFDHSLELKRLLEERQTSWIPIEGGGHNDLVLFDAYREGIEKALEN